MMEVALAFSVIFCAATLIPLVHCYSNEPREYTNIIPISRRSLLNRRTLAGDFDAVFAREEQQAVYQKYWTMAPEILAGIFPAPENDMEKFVQSKYVNEVSPDTDNVMEQVVGPVDVSNVLLTMSMTDVIVNEVDMLYYGDLAIGTPGQGLTFDIDTGSADLWVPSPWCSTCTKNHYDGSQSSTYVDKGRRFAVSYGSGTVYGTTASDTVAIAGTAVQNQTFGVVYRESEDFQEYPNDGILGMAFGTIAQSRGLTVFETMMKQGKLKWPCFSVHLARSQETGSEMCWGCYDPTKATGPISWFPVSHRAYWSIPMSAFEVAGQRTMFDEVIISAIDTGTTFCYFPASIAAEIYSQIPGSKDASESYGSGFYTYPCASKVDLGFVFGDVAFRLHPDDFNLGESVYNPAECMGGIFAMDATEWPSNLAIIGDEFLKSWYSVYDYSDGGRVGFAPSVNNQ
ncbi:aspartic peptidase domain-containing protein [Lentinula detonsa]|uniref:Aspartic peptidase domain-containing protein n=1 Tax=Lentinula detonsa TaxID=2804962 RepID=A0AA38Q1A0_9AGAR|nr:aspartic peptidase domain-containing protein [Lentinula detonsa]